MNAFLLLVVGLGFGLFAIYLRSLTWPRKKKTKLSLQIDAAVPKRRWVDPQITTRSRTDDDLVLNPLVSPIYQANFLAAPEVYNHVDPVEQSSRDIGSAYDSSPSDSSSGGGGSSDGGGSSGSWD